MDDQNTAVVPTEEIAAEETASTEEAAPAADEVAA